MPYRDMVAVILAGGMGTRLSAVVSDRPKVLAEVGGKPFITYLFEQIQAGGIQRVVLCTGYKADQIQKELGDRYGNLGIRYSREDSPLGTGGALRLALPLIEGEAALIMNGDSYTQVDFKAFLSWFLEKQLSAAMVLTWMKDTSRYGTVGLNSDKTVACFREKSKNTRAAWINAGIYLMKESLIATIPSGVVYSLEKDLLPKLAGSGLCGFCAEGRFIDIGIPQDYAKAESFFCQMSGSR